MKNSSVTLDNVERSMLINLIASGLSSDKFTEEEKNLLKKLKKRLQEIE
jgi:hypothetical protein